jgi:hypothetical protein
VSAHPDFYIFRDARRRLAAVELLRPLRSALVAMPSRAEIDELIALLLRAGELECALCDAKASPEDCEAAEQLTDALAESAVRTDCLGRTFDGREIVAASLPLLDKIGYSGAVNVGASEGFAYYALHPLDYVDRVATLEENWQSAFVIGIRSIGTTLSAIVASKLRERGVAADRFTVRPSGHPYDRHCAFSEDQLPKIRAALAHGSQFLVCDEGPGRSGSSLLSVAEALVRAAVPCSSIRILCSHEPDVGSLCTPEAARRWSQFRSMHTGMTKRLPRDAAEYFGNGEWRWKIFSRDHEWPPVWSQFERLTYGSGDGGSLLMFEGHGQFGEAVRNRNQKLSDAGFSLPYLGQEVGFGRQRLMDGSTARAEDLAPALLARMAEYCAWRAREFAVAEVDSSELDTMARVNFEREFGYALSDLNLCVVRPTICDNQMMPHAWLKAATGEWLKLDAATRGDDHFFPGPCDVAWDLAGVSVEWRLSPADRASLLRSYQNASGDNAADRLAAYELAYAIFRMAWSRMAATSVSVTSENARLMRDYERYRCWLQSAACVDNAQRNEVQTQLS